MDCRALAFRQLPHQPKLFLEYLDHFERVKAFYAHPPKMQVVTRTARKLDYPRERRTEVAELLRKQSIALGAGAETQSNLARLEKGAVAIVTGQQVGLFSGPAYAIYKALTAVQIAEELTRGGIPAVPVFWMATEDHDLDEVRTATLNCRLWKRKDRWGKFRSARKWSRLRGRPRNYFRTREAICLRSI